MDGVRFMFGITLGFFITNIIKLAIILHVDNHHVRDTAVSTTAVAVAALNKAYPIKENEYLNKAF